MTRAFPTVVLLLASAIAHAQSLPPSSSLASGLADPRPPDDPAAWKKVKTIDQVYVDRAESAVDKQPWSRGVSHFDLPMARVVAHILDFENLPRFFSRMKEVRVVEKQETSAIVYYRLDLPWPIDDRHWTVFYRWQLDVGHFTLAWSDANHKQPLDVKKAVVVPVVRGTWVLTQDGEGRTRGEIIQLISLGSGWLPRSVVDETVWKQPLETFRGMRKALGLAQPK